MPRSGNMDTPAVDRVLHRAGHQRSRPGRGSWRRGLPGRRGLLHSHPFGTPSEVDESQICQWTHDVLELAGTFEQVILMVHTPPRAQVVDKLPSGAHVGSPGVRALIEKYQPAIVVTGHIHEGAGEEMIAPVAREPRSLCPGRLCAHRRDSVRPCGGIAERGMILHVFPGT